MHFRRLSEGSLGSSAINAFLVRFDLGDQIFRHRVGPRNRGGSGPWPFYLEVIFISLRGPKALSDSLAGAVAAARRRRSYLVRDWEVDGSKPFRPLLLERIAQDRAVGARIPRARPL